MNSFVKANERSIILTKRLNENKQKHCVVVTYLVHLVYNTYQSSLTVERLRRHQYQM